jgi:hypothetical protein
MPVSKCLINGRHGTEKDRARQTVFTHTTPTKFSRRPRARASAIAKPTSIGEINIQKRKDFCGVDFALLIAQETVRGNANVHRQQIARCVNNQVSNSRRMRREHAGKFVERSSVFSVHPW